MTRSNLRRKTRRQRKSGRKLFLQTLEDRRLLAAGPYAPAAGLDGSTAIARTDTAIVGWATAVADYSPGSNVESQWQNASEALGPAEGEFSEVVSLGRGGSITLTFENPIRDGLGNDFAIFENSFSDTFLEFAFVEVSSNGVNFIRFDGVSLTDAPVASFGETDPTNIRNLAGKYRGGFGTPFDLQELRGRVGLDVTAITHVRIVDIVGNGLTQDSQGNPIYDPTPTDISAGLDLDGIGVMRQVEFGTVNVDLEDLGASLGDQNFDNGTNANGSFTEDELTLNNRYDTQFGSWSGWAISQTTDTTTAGFTNQYSAVAGEGHDGSETYAVGFFDSSPSNPQSPPTITLDSAIGSQFDSLWITNTTYAARSMELGDTFAKKFGGATGNDADFLAVDIIGVNGLGSEIGSVEVILADYRFTDNTLDNIVDQWTRVDLTDLRSASELRFQMRSSDNSTFGMNTPAYFAIDDVTLRRAAVPFDLEGDVTGESQSVNARISRPTQVASTPLDFELVVSNPEFASVLTEASIPAGSDFVDFAIAPVADELVSPDRDIQITANGDNLLPTTRRLTIEDEDTLALAASLSEPTLREGSNQSTTLTITRNETDISQPLTVSLSSNAANRLTFPASVTLAPQQRDVEVTISTNDNDVFTGDRTYTLLATTSDRPSVSADLTLQDDDIPALTVDSIAGQLSESILGDSLTLTVRRNTSDTSQPLAVSISTTDRSPFSIPSSFNIDAGESFATVPVVVVDDNFQNELSEYSIRFTNDSFASATATIPVIDNDTSSLAIHFTSPDGNPIASITEGSAFDILFERQFAVTEHSQTVELSSNLGDRLIGPSSVEIPAGSVSHRVTYRVADDSVATGTLSLDVTVNAAGFETSNRSLDIIDANQPQLTLQAPGNGWSESVGATLADFESLGRSLTPGEADNNAAVPNSSTPNAFVSGGLAFENSFDNSLGFDVWSGFAISRDFDSDTGGFFNQFAAYAGFDTPNPQSIGTGGSDTYAVAFASSPIAVSRTSESQLFESLAITNTAYAGLSMQNGDSFAKSFGGETGDDPDFFLLTINGLDASDQSIGTVEFYLADYRFEDNSLDYIVDDWTTVDLSSIGSALKLEMTLTSSDVGTFGMNTPAYFAIDDLELATAPEVQPNFQVGRTLSATDDPIVVQLTSDSDHIRIPSSVTIGIGETFADVPISFRNDDIVNVDRTITITASSEGFQAETKAFQISEDDLPTLTIRPSLSQISEVIGSSIIDFEDVGVLLANDSFDNGSNRRGGFPSGQLHFPTDYNPAFGSWSGWAASNVTDVTTPGFGNQFASYASEADTYAIGGGYGLSPPTISIPESLSGGSFESIEITNTTYAALSMLAGDQFAKQFGGASGDDPDFFLLKIEGFDQDRTSVGIVDFYLADYRPEDNSLDTLVSDWTTVDLTSLSNARSIQFRLSSSDNGDFGMNTPAYFAIDNLSISQPISQPNAAAPSTVISRNVADTQEPLTVQLQSSDSGRLAVGTEVVIPAGQRSVRVPISVTDNATFDFDNQVTISANAVEFQGDSVSLNVIDNELPEILTNAGHDNLSIVEGGASTSVSIQLATPPTSPTTIQVAAAEDNFGQLNLSPQTLLFTAENFDQPQQIDISGAPDLLIEETSVFPIQLMVQTGDAFADSLLWIELNDYQPAAVSLTLENEMIVLADDAGTAVFEQFDGSDDINIQLNDQNQSITLVPIEQARGLITIDAKGGDDQIIVQSQHVTSLDGGEGIDRLVLQPTDLVEGNEVLDVSRWLRNRAVRFEEIYLGALPTSGPAPEITFILDSEDLAAQLGSQPAKLLTSAGQDLQLLGTWQFGTPIIDGTTVIQRLLGAENSLGNRVNLEVRTTRPWQNSMQHEDVNGSGDVTANDALVIINRINSDESSDLPAPSSAEEFLGKFYDVSGDGRVTAIDALQVINRLNEDDLAQPELVLDVNDQTIALGPVASVGYASVRETAKVPDVKFDQNRESALGSIWNNLLPESTNSITSPPTSLSTSPPPTDAVDEALREISLFSQTDDFAPITRSMKRT